LNIQTKKRKILFIDFAKGFAMLSIVVFHFFSPYTTGIFSKAIMFAGAGVHVFILLSGFGLALSSVNLKLKSFYIKRFTKILIPYYIAVIIIFLFNLHFNFYKENDLYALFGHILFYKMFDSTIVGSFGGQFWFISTIIQFYIFFPVIIFFKSKYSINQFLITSLFISAIYWLIVSLCKLNEVRIYNSFFLQYLWEFNLGIYLSDLYIKKEFKFWEFNNLLMVIIISSLSLFLMAFISLNGGEVGRSFNDVPSLISYLGFLIIFYTLVEKLNLKLIFYFFVKLGKFSYELFLLHSFVFVMVNLFLVNVIKMTPNILSTFILVLPISIIISYLYSKAIIYLHKLLLLNSKI
jgi:peptidoglycan/LPS O-acetylase OafA/YrhL